MHRSHAPQENEDTQVTRNSFIQRSRGYSAVFAAIAWLALVCSVAGSIEAQPNSKDYIYLGGRVIAIENPVQVATKLSVTASSSQVAGTPFNVTVTALDQNGNTVASYHGTVSFTTSDTQTAPPANATLSNGTVTVSATLVTAGPQTITATDTTNSSLTGISGQINVAPGAPSSIAAPANTTPQSAQINAAFGTPLSVTVKDASGNPVSGVNVTFTAPSSGATCHFNNSSYTIQVATNASGVAAVVSFTANATAGPYTVTAATPGLTTAVNFSLTNTTGTAQKIAIGSGTTPQSVQISAVFGTLLSVTAQDAYGNPVSGVNVTFTVTAASNGAAGTFAGGSYSCQATSGTNGVALASALTANGTPGSYSVAATAVVAGVSLPTVNFSMTNTTGTPSSMTVGSGTTPQSAVVQSPFGTALSVTVLDATQKPISGIYVTFTAPTTCATPPCATGTFNGNSSVITGPTNTSGATPGAVFTANSTAGGPYTVTATIAGTSVTPVTFSLSNTAGPAQSMTAGSNTTPQSASMKSPFGTPLSVTVNDAHGNPVSGVSVTFTAPSSGATGQFSNGTGTITVPTSSSGVASAGTFTANSIPGSYTVAAAAPGTTGVPSVTFNLTNTTGAPSRMTQPINTSPQNVFINTQVQYPLSVTVYDANNNPISGVSVTFTVTPALNGASGTFTNGYTAITVTTVSGVASAGPFTANSTVSASGVRYSVTATIAGTSVTPVSFYLTNVVGSVAQFLVTAPSSVT